MTNERIGIVLLAAGNSSRFGSAKQLLLIDGISMVRRAVLAAVHTGGTVVVVTGAHQESVGLLLSDLAVTVAFNPQWRLGMGSSIAYGVDCLNKIVPHVDAVIISLADQPLITTADLARLICSHRDAPQRIIAASYCGTLGPPCLFPSAYFPDLSKLKSHEGARSVLQSNADKVDAMPLPHGATDIDTPQDYARLISSSI